MRKKDTFSTIDGRRMVYQPIGGDMHLCEGADVHDRVRLIWTVCKKMDVPAGSAWLMRPEDTITCEACLATERARVSAEITWYREPVFKSANSPIVGRIDYPAARVGKALAILDVIESANSLHCDDGSATVRIQFVEHPTALALFHKLTDR